MRYGIALHVAQSLMLWLCVFVTSTFAADVATDWKTECVGRFQVSVPGGVEVAEYRLRPEFDNYRFGDGSIAAYSKSINSGEVDASEKVPFQTYLAHIERANNAMQKQKRDLESSGAGFDREQAKGTQPILFSEKNVYGWISQASSNYAVWVDMYREGRIVFYQVSGINTFAEAKETAHEFVRNFRPRPLYMLPKGAGVCIPYGFIADDGKPGRDIGVTMRLKDHPEVEIFFEDQTAPRPYKEGAHLADSEHLNAGFWDIKSRRTKRIEVLFPGYRRIQLDGRTGTASFAEITQKDGSKDYGFVAAVAGDYTAKTDTPELMLYVIRTASRAKGTPISKSELKDMAKKIAASIKRREVK